MASSKKKKSAATVDETPAPEAPKKGGGRALKILAALVLIVGGAGGGFAVYRQRKHPSWQWARRMEQLHSTRLEARITRCFGGADAATIRQQVPSIRRGTMTPTLRACSGPVLTELAVAPMELGGLIGEPPSTATAAKTRVRDRLEYLTQALATLQRALEGLDRSQTIPDDQRDRIVTALEDVAVDVDAERTAFQSMVQAAENDARIF